MSDAIRQYVQDVVANLMVDEHMKERIERDLHHHIAELGANGDEEAIIRRMGPPDKLPGSLWIPFMKTKSRLLASCRKKMQAMERRHVLEYKTRASFCGLPLVHVNIGWRYGRPRVAKGIVAVGDVALGLVSLGGVALGAIGLGGLTLGIVAVGGLASGGLALGGWPSALLPLAAWPSAV